MTTFTERLAALAEWPEEPKYIPQGALYWGKVYPLDDTAEADAEYQTDRADALEDRLRLAVELLERILCDDMSDLRKSLSADARALVEKVRGGTRSVKRADPVLLPSVGTPCPDRAARVLLSAFRGARDASSHLRPKLARPRRHLDRDADPRVDNDRPRPRP